VEMVSYLNKGTPYNYVSYYLFVEKQEALMLPAFCFTICYV